MNGRTLGLDEILHFSFSHQVIQGPHFHLLLERTIPQWMTRDANQKERAEMTGTLSRKEIVGRNKIFKI